MKKTQRSRFVSNTASNAAFFVLGALVFISFTIIYTRQFGVEQYGVFSFLLNTATALIALGAYEGFLITHSLVQTRSKFNAFNRRYMIFNAGLIVIAAIAFAIVTGRFEPLIILAVASAIYLDYRSQSAIAVLIISDRNWKIRGCRTAYQILLVAGFLALRYAGIALDYAFAFAILAASVTNYTLLIRSARQELPETNERGAPKFADAEPNVLMIAVASNLATVLVLLLDKITIRLFDVGGDYSIGLYFLFFDLATRAEALYLLISVPVTNHLFARARDSDIVARDIALMIAGSIAIGATFAVGGYFLIPLIYDVSLTGNTLLPWVFGLYVAARGIRYIVKAVCNATGLHITLMLSNYLVFAAGGILLLIALWSGGGAVSVSALAVILTAAHLLRAPVLAKIMMSRRGLGEDMKLGVA